MKLDDAQINTMIATIDMIQNEHDAGTIEYTPGAEAAERLDLANHVEQMFDVLQMANLEQATLDGLGQHGAQGYQFADEHGNVVYSVSPDDYKNVTPALLQSAVEKARTLLESLRA